MEMKLKKNRKGVLAILDALIAYSIAFVIIGAIVVVLSNTHHEIGQTSLALNQQAEDIADAMALSWVMFDEAEYYPEHPYRCDTKSSIESDFLDALDALALRNGLRVKIDLDNPTDTDEIHEVYGIADNFDGVTESASATRFLLEDNADGTLTGEICTLSITLGV
jgi:hypothetical protein